METNRKQPAQKVCPICGGGLIVYRPSGGKNSTSYLEVCSCVEEKCMCDKTPPYIFFDEESAQVKECSCSYARRKLGYIHKLFGSSNIPRKYRYRRLSEFKTQDSKDVGLLIAYDKAEKLITNIKNARKGICYLGPVGSGKTFLGCLILNEVILQHVMPVRFLKITRHFFNEIRSTYNSESAMYGKGEDIFQEIINTPVLLIDDFGVQADSAWEQRMLYDLIDARYESEKITLITTNLNKDELKPLFGGRVYSRLKEMTDFQVMVSTDYRDKFFVES